MIRQTEEFIAALELVAHFSRCKNYPRETEGVNLLAEELVQASGFTGIEMSAIVAKCREVASICPEYSDMLNIAREIKEDRRRVADDEAYRKNRAQWEKQFGPPSKVSVDWDLASAAKALDRLKEIDHQVARHLGVSSLNPNPSRCDLQNVSLHDKFKAMQDLGYPLTPEQHKYL